MGEIGQTKNYYALLIWSLRTKGRWMVDSAADGAVEGPWAMVWDDMEESAAVRVGTLYISSEQLKCVPLTWLGHWLSGQMKSARLRWPVVIVQTDTLYISTEQLKRVQCIVRGSFHISLTWTEASLWLGIEILLFCPVVFVFVIRIYIFL